LIQTWGGRWWVMRCGVGRAATTATGARRSCHPRGCARASHRSGDQDSINAAPWGRKKTRPLFRTLPRRNLGNARSHTARRLMPIGNLAAGARRPGSSPPSGWRGTRTIAAGRPISTANRTSMPWPARPRMRVAPRRAGGRGRGRAAAYNDPVPPRRPCQATLVLSPPGGYCWRSHIAPVTIPFIRLLLRMGTALQTTSPTISRGRVSVVVEAGAGLDKPDTAATGGRAKRAAGYGAVRPPPVRYSGRDR